MLRSLFYPWLDVDGAGTQVVSQAGALLLTGTIATVGLDRALSTALQAWRPRLAVHDPAKVLLDLRSSAQSSSSAASATPEPLSRPAVRGHAVSELLRMGPG